MITCRKLHYAPQQRPVFVVDRQRLALSYRCKFFETFEVYSRELEERRDGPAGTDSPCKPTVLRYPSMTTPLNGARSSACATPFWAVWAFLIFTCPMSTAIFKRPRGCPVIWARTCSNAWVELGGAIEPETDERVFTSTVDTIFQDEQGVQDTYVPFSSYAFFLDAMVSSVWSTGLFRGPVFRLHRGSPSRTPLASKRAPRRFPRHHATFARGLRPTGWRY